MSLSNAKEVAGTVGDLVEQRKVRFFGLSEAEKSNIRRTHSNGFMKPYALFLSLTVLALSSCGSFNPSASSGFGQNDFAVGVASPNGPELSLAQKRLQNFLGRANARQRELLGQNPVVAVQANQVDASEVPGLIYQLSAGQIGNAVAYYASDPDNPTAVPVKFLVLIDSRTGRLVSPGGVLVIDTPPRGIVADFRGVKAVYAGTGWW
jgi:hypothetical protein